MSPGQFRGSLMFKLITAFFVVSILGIVLVALLAGMITQMEYKRLMTDMQYEGLIADLVEIHTQDGGLENASDSVEESVSRWGMDGSEFLIIDSSGNILLSFTHQQLPNVSPEELSRFGIPIAVNSRVVGYLIPFHPMDTELVDVGSNIRRTNAALRLGVFGAALLVLTTGYFISRRILRPVRQLSKATRAIAEGDLDQEVRVVSRDEIGELANSFNQMSKSLKKSRDLRRQLTADIAHELRNPLSIIMGNAEAISEGVLPPTQEAAEVIYDEARHLSKLIDDLRELSLSEAGELPLHFGQVNLSHLFEKLQRHFALMLEEKALKLNPKVSADCPLIQADEHRLVQVLTNVIKNSIKHSPHGAVIILKAVKAPPLVDHVPSVLITVEDQGSGIAAEDLPYIFDRFYRGKMQGDRVQDGTGLGLAISRSLVENHGGRISARSVPTVSTVVSIVLPISGPTTNGK